MWPVATFLFGGLAGVVVTLLVQAAFTLINEVSGGIAGLRVELQNMATTVSNLKIAHGTNHGVVMNKIENLQNDVDDLKKPVIPLVEAIPHEDAIDNRTT